MFFRQRAAENATLSYFFGCTGIGRSVAVDVVAGDEDWFIAEATKVGVPISYVIDTHVHADHRSGGLELARRAGAPYCLHESNRGRTSFDFTPLSDGQRLDAGNVVVDVLHTPGHSPDSVCLLVRDLRRGDEPWFLSPATRCSSAPSGGLTLRGASEKWRRDCTTACIASC